MGYPFPGIGVVFDIGGLGGGSYGDSAWKIFVDKIDPEQLGGAILVEGDTNATISGSANEFCIGVYALGDLEHVRSRFEDATDAGLAPFHRRFIEKRALDEQPLPPRGRIDAFGRLVTDVWTLANHRLCWSSRWGYAPTSVPEGLDATLLSQLKELRNRTGF